jgi:hypothetical protein
MPDEGNVWGDEPSESDGEEDRSPGDEPPISPVSSSWSRGIPAIEKCFIPRDRPSPLWVMEVCRLGISRIDRYELNL